MQQIIFDKLTFFFYESLKVTKLLYKHLFWPFHTSPEKCRQERLIKGAVLRPCVCMNMQTEPVRCLLHSTENKWLCVYAQKCIGCSRLPHFFVLVSPYYQGFVLQHVPLPKMND